MGPGAALLLWLLGAPGRAAEVAASTKPAEGFVKPPPAPWSCRPGIDVRPVLSIEHAGRRIAHVDDIMELPTKGHKRAAAYALSAVCGRRANAVQEIAKHFAAPVRVLLPQQCHSISTYESGTRTVHLRSFAPCARDPEGSLLHELSHAWFMFNAARHARLRPVIDCAYRLPGHDGGIFDPDDHTILLAMDAETHPLRALDEGLANAVSVAFYPFANRSGRYIELIESESRSRAWRRKTWRQQQANEHFVSAVLSEYLGANHPAALARLPRIGRVLRSRGPQDLQELLMGLMDEDPVADRPRIDRILGRFAAAWDSEREELLRLRRQRR